MSMLHVYTACQCPHCMSMSILHFHVYATCPCLCNMFMSMVHVQVRAAVHVHAACQCPCFKFMSVLYVHVHAAGTVRRIYWDMQDGHGHPAWTWTASQTWACSMKMNLKLVLDMHVFISMFMSTVAMGTARSPGFVSFFKSFSLMSLLFASYHLLYSLRIIR